MKERIEIFTLEEMVGKDLSNFKIMELHEVYMTNEDGRWVKSLGFFKSKEIARGFAQIQVDSTYHKTGNQFVLTDGKIGFILGKTIKLVDEEKSKLEVAKAAKAKLGPEMAAALGIS